MTAHCTTHQPHPFANRWQFPVWITKTGFCRFLVPSGEWQELASPPLGLSRWLDGFYATLGPQQFK